MHDIISLMESMAIDDTLPLWLQQQQLAGKKHANDLLKKSKSLLKKSNLLNHLLILSKFLLFAFFKQTLEIF
jgi:hypothetical protein